MTYRGEYLYCMESFSEDSSILQKYCKHEFNEYWLSILEIKWRIHSIVEAKPLCLPSMLLRMTCFDYYNLPVVWAIKCEVISH